MTAETLYHKSLRAYLLTKSIPALSTCLKAMTQLPVYHPTNTMETEQLRLNIWTLYFNMASTLLAHNNLAQTTKSLGIPVTESMEEACRSVWYKLVEDYANDISQIHPQLISICVVLNMQLNMYVVGREIVESWFATLSDSVLDYISLNQEKSDMLVNEYINIVNMYVTQLLPSLHDYESAMTFIEYNSVLSDTRKQSLQTSIQAHEQSRLEQETLKKEQAQKEIDQKKEAHRLESEKKRIEQIRLAELARMEEEQKRMARQLEDKKMSLENPQELPSREEYVQSRSVEPRQSMHVKMVKKWVGHLTAKGVASYSAILMVVFALFALLRGQRGRLSVALQTLLSKMWQTIQMGTKVSYM